VGGKPQSLAIIEIKAPSMTFPNQEVKDAFVKKVTDIVDELKAGSHPSLNVPYPAMAQRCPQFVSDKNPQKNQKP
jgi:hypothetical protein